MTIWYQKKITDEKFKLMEKHFKLKKFLETDIFYGLTEEQRGMLELQEKTMQLYIKILETRLKWLEEEGL